jgi:hypothetical protein
MHWTYRAWAMAAITLSLSGCCGGSLIPGYSDSGTVAFDELPVGQSEALEIPIQGNAGDETFTSGSIAGEGAAAFQVLSSFPMAVTAGTPATVRVRFSPLGIGTFPASLVLDTATMGASEIPLLGAGIAVDGG